MKTYVATGAEARGLRKGTISLVVIPMEPQPEYWDRHFPMHTVNLGTSSTEVQILCPYSWRDEIGIKEAWAITRNDHGHRCLWYRADSEDSVEPQMMLLWDQTHGTWAQHPTEFRSPRPDKWKLAAKMPLYAIRTRVLCRSVEARQVCSITEKEAEATGVEREISGHHELDWRDYSRPKGCSVISAEASFASLWNRRHPGLPWAGNPWAWFATVKLERKP